MEKHRLLFPKGLCATTSDSMSDHEHECEVTALVHLLTV